MIVAEAVCPPAITSGVSAVDEPASGASDQLPCWSDGGQPQGDEPRRSGPPGRQPRRTQASALSGARSTGRRGLA
jgi:hypothetical protein